MSDEQMIQPTDINGQLLIVGERLSQLIMMQKRIDERLSQGDRTFNELRTVDTNIDRALEDYKKSSNNAINMLSGNIADLTDQLKALTKLVEQQQVAINQLQLDGYIEGDDGEKTSIKKQFIIDNRRRLKWERFIGIASTVGPVISGIIVALIGYFATK